MPFIEFCQTHKVEICFCLSAIAVICIIVGIVLWLTSGELSESSKSGSPGGPGSLNVPGVFAPPIARLQLPAEVQYDNGRDKYTVKYPIGSVTYRSTSGEVSQFILPPGGPRQILPNRTTRYNVSADLQVTHNSRPFVMPSGSLIQLETTTDDKAVFCTWIGGDHTMFFIANQDAQSDQRARQTLISQAIRNIGHDPHDPHGDSESLP